MGDPFGVKWNAKNQRTVFVSELRCPQLHKYN